MNHEFSGFHDSACSPWLTRHAPADRFRPALPPLSYQTHLIPTLSCHASVSKGCFYSGRMESGQHLKGFHLPHVLRHVIHKADRYAWPSMYRITRVLQVVCNSMYGRHPVKKIKSPERLSIEEWAVPGYRIILNGGGKTGIFSHCPSGYFALDALSPAILPNTVMSASAFPPRRLVPWMPPVTSPAA